tara:strand:- start:49 stop:372 length:324 start_codon:yes stop_codon:yes gene_type:complete
MRKITIDAVNAFHNGNKFKRGNTEVKTYPHSNYRELILHGNIIAELGEQGLYISSCGYPTMTTKERLNGIRGVNIEQKNWNWYLNGEYWDGSRIKVWERFFISKDLP